MSYDIAVDRDVQPYLLIVDDELGVLEVTRSMALALGWRPLLASNAEHALALFREHARSIETALIDLHMPGMDGAELAGSMRAVSPGARLFFMTGDAVRAEALVDGLHLADGVLVKPFALEELGRTIEFHARPV